jgi:hypothetical protein
MTSEDNLSCLIQGIRLAHYQPCSRIWDWGSDLPWNRSGTGLDFPSSCLVTKAWIKPRIAIFAYYPGQTGNFSLEMG